MPFESNSIRNPRVYDIKRVVASGSSDDKVWMKSQESARVTRKKIYSCCLCEFVEEAVGFDSLEPIENRKYLHHLKASHGLEP